MKYPLLARLWRLCALSAVCWTTTTAMAADEEVGTEVVVRVIDATGAAIPTAVVRHPLEQDRHRVNVDNGEWRGRILYMPDGTELIFEKGMEVEFEVSAPGFQNRRVGYLVRKRKNLVEVELQKMEINMADEDPEDVIIQFGRDKPID